MSEKQVYQLAMIMKFLDTLGFDLATVKCAADCWWKAKALPDPPKEPK